MSVADVPHDAVHMAQTAEMRRRDMKYVQEQYNVQLNRKNKKIKKTLRRCINKVARDYQIAACSFREVFF